MSICVHVVSRTEYVARLFEGIFNLAGGEQGSSSRVLEKSRLGQCEEAVR